MQKELKIFRKKFLIYPKFQLVLLGFNALLFALTTSFIIFEAQLSFSYLYQIGERSGLSVNHAYFRFIELQSKVFLTRICTGLALSLVVSSIFVLLFSHKLAGPIVRLREYLKKTAQSSQSPEPLTFRKGDFFDDLPELVNQALKNSEHKDKKSA